MMDNSQTGVNNPDYKEDVEAIKHIYDTRDTLADNVRAAGAEVADDDKICEIAEKVPGMVLPHGETKVVRVTKAGVVYPGDFVAYARELSPENVGAIAAGVELLDAVTLNDGRVVCMFAQNSVVKVKALAYRDNAIVLGADLALPNATSGAKLGAAGDNLVAVLYSTEEGGAADIISFDDLTPTLALSDIWEDVPVYNIAICSWGGNKLWVAYLHDDATETCAHLEALTVSTTALTITGHTEFGEGVCRDEFDAMFCLSALDDTRLAVSWFVGYDKPVHWTIAYRFTDGGDYVATTEDDTLVYQGSVGRTSFVAARDGSTLVFANAIVREGTESVASKSLITLERWDIGDSAYDTTPIWYGAAEVQYNADLGLASVSPLDDNGALITWVRNGSAFATIVPYDDPQASRSPSVPLGGAQDSLIPLKITRTGALMAILRMHNGDLRIDVYRTTDVVVPTTTGSGVGIALAAANAGETVEISLA